MNVEILIRYLTLALSIGFFVSLWRNYFRSCLGIRISKLDKEVFKLFDRTIAYGRWAPNDSAESSLKYHKWKVVDDCAETVGLVLIVGLDAEFKITKEIIPLPVLGFLCIFLLVYFCYRYRKMRLEDFV